ncbi:MAG: hypothetical protein AAFN77_19095, partial [Planctomycetota bacterium]
MRFSFDPAIEYRQEKLRRFLEREKVEYEYRFAEYEYRFAEYDHEEGQNRNLVFGFRSVVAHKIVLVLVLVLENATQVDAIQLRPCDQLPAGKTASLFG